MKVLNFGSLNLDYFYKVNSLVKPGQTISANEFSIDFGGKGLNQSIALARATVSVYHAGLIGENGKELKEYCLENNINVEFIKESNKSTGHAIIQVDEKGENSIILYKGANFEITKYYVDYVLDKFDKDDIILLQNEISLVGYIIEEAKKREMKIAFNPAPMNSSVKGYRLDYVDYLIVNETEAFELTDLQNPEEAIKKLKEEYNNEIIIITLGKEGLIYIEDNTVKKIEGIKINSIDTTAAGDTFIGYFLAMINKNNNVFEALTFANKAAALKVTKEGSSKSIPKMKEVNEWIFN